MRTFFKGWRRKLGVVALGLACVFAAAWVRSLSSTDGARIGYGTHSRLIIASGNRRLVLVGQEFDFPRTDSPFIEFHSAPFVSNVIDHEGVELKWAFELLGFLIGQSEHVPAIFLRFFFVAVPYWSVVIPLTLLSAWLLLSKPKRLPDERCGD